MLGDFQSTADSPGANHSKNIPHFFLKNFDRVQIIAKQRLFHWFWANNFIKCNKEHYNVREREEESSRVFG